MKDERIRKAYEPVKPTPAEKEAMLARILEAREQPAERKSRWRNRRDLHTFLPAACAAAVILCAVALPQHFDVPVAPDESDWYAEVQGDAAAGDVMCLSDGSGDTVLAELTEEESHRVAALLAQADPVDLSGPQMKAIADARERGDSFRLVWQTEDGDTRSFELFPTLSLFLEGESGCRLTGELARTLETACVQAE